MQNEPEHKAEHTSTNNIANTIDASSAPSSSPSSSLPSSNQIENPDKALLELFRESKESPQALIIQLYFYGGIAMVGLCAAIFLMMTLA